MDRAKAIAYRQHRIEHCTECGTREDEWKPELGGNRWAYVAETFRCVGCELIAAEQDNIPPEEKGIKIALIRNPEHAEDDDG